MSGETRARLVAAALVGLSALATLYFVWTMGGGMPMPGGWTMSMMWMPMPGQGWLAAALSFVAMWMAMMVAMMLPSALPMLLLYRRTLAFRGEPRVDLLTSIVGAGYFIVWLAFGVGAFAVGAGISEVAMRASAVSRAVPAIAGIALVAAGVYQFTPWKSFCLRHCRDPIGFLAKHLRADVRSALELGLHHGAFCAGCCAGLMIVQLAVGVMSVAAMVAVAAVIAAEKLLPAGPTIARAFGVVAIAGGIAVIAGVPLPA